MNKLTALGSTEASRAKAACSSRRKERVIFYTKHWFLLKNAQRQTVERTKFWSKAVQSSVGAKKVFYPIHRIHKWQTRGKKLGPSHESEALEGKQKLQMKTFSELAECLARIPPKITLYGLLFKYNYVGCLLLLMFSIDLLFAIKREAYIFKETGWFSWFHDSGWAFTLPLPFFFLLPLQISRYNSTGNACYAGYANCTMQLTQYYNHFQYMTTTALHSSRSSFLKFTSIRKQ